MKLKQWIKIVLIGSSILALTACSSMRKHNDDGSINDANAAYGAQSSGTGDGSSFGDSSGMTKEQLLSKRVYYFDYDQSAIHDSDKAALSANADYLMAHPNVKVLLEGHTDPRGSREYNIALGERRARAVADFLQAKGVEASQVRVISYGSEKLATPGHDEGDYQQDRRVVLVYLQ